LIDAAGKPSVGGNTSEHSMVGVGALLVGRQTASYRIWDGIRSLDYLAGRSEVDSKRLGCTGNSGGGTLTAYLMALDDRIVAAAPSCYITTLEQLFATIGPQDAEQNITGQVAFGMEQTDYVTMRAPKPTLICVGTQDFFDINGAWTTYREAKRLYGALGFGERVDLFEYNDKHGFSRPRREAACRWMLRWLKNDDTPVVEGDFPVFTDAQLQCTKSGQVLIDFKNGKSVIDLNAERADELAADRAKAGRSTQELLREVRRLTAFVEPAAAAKFESVGNLSGADMDVVKGVLTVEAGMPCPMLVLVPRKDGRFPLVIRLDGGGKAEGRTAAAGPVAAGKMVVSLDLRGTGETAPGAPATKRPDYLGAEWKEAFLSLHLSRPLLGQRLGEVLSVVRAPPTPALPGPELHAVGAAGPVALHAAALDPRIKSLTLERSILSWTAVVKAGISHNQLSNAVPGALAVYDLPDLAATLAPRKLVILNPVDPTGRPVSQEELERIYAPVKAAYARAGAEKELELRAGR
jgi:dienelactone hydrolase